MFLIVCLKAADAYVDAAMIGFFRDFYFLFGHLALFFQQKNVRA